MKIKKCCNCPHYGFFRAPLMAQKVKNLPATQEIWVRSLGWKDLLEKEWQPTSVFLLGEFHAQKSLTGYSPWGRKELDMTEWLTLSHFQGFFSKPRRSLPKETLHLVHGDSYLTCKYPQVLYLRTQTVVKNSIMLFPKRQQSIILSQTYWITLNKLLAKKVIVGTHRKGSLSKLIGIFNIKLKIQYRIQKFISLLSQHLFWICKITERELLKLCVIMSQIYFTYFSLIKDLHVVQVARGLYNEMIAGVVVKTLKSQLWLVGTEQVKTRLDHCPLSTSGNVWLVNFWGGRGDSWIALARFGTCRSQEFSYTSTEGQFLHSFPVTRLVRVPTLQAAALFLFFNPPTTEPLPSEGGKLETGSFVAEAVLWMNPLFAANLGVSAFWYLCFGQNETPLECKDLRSSQTVR